MNYANFVVKSEYNLLFFGICCSNRLYRYSFHIVPGNTIFAWLRKSFQHIQSCAYNSYVLSRQNTLTHHSIISKQRISWEVIACAAETAGHRYQYVSLLLWYLKCSLPDERKLCQERGSCPRWAHRRVGPACKPSGYRSQHAALTKGCCRPPPRSAAPHPAPRLQQQAAYDFGWKSSMTFQFS